MDDDFGFGELIELDDGSELIEEPESDTSAGNTIVVVPIPEVTEPTITVPTIPTVVDPVFPVITASDVGTPGEAPSTQIDSEPTAVPEYHVVTYNRYLYEQILDFSQESLDAYEANGYDAIAVYDDGTEAVVPWSEVHPLTSQITWLELETAEAANATNQYFWTDEHGSHITGPETKEDWVEESAKSNYGNLSNPTDQKPWHNTLLNSLGLLFRKGLNNLATFTKSAVAFFDGNGNQVDNITAFFGKNSAQIGKSEESHIILDSTGFAIANGENLKVLEASGFSQKQFSYSERIDIATTGDVGSMYIIAFSEVVSISYPLNGEPVETTASVPGIRLADAEDYVGVFLVREGQKIPINYSIVESHITGYSFMVDGITILPNTNYDVVAEYYTYSGWLDTPSLRLGNRSKSHAILDYHSLQMMDKEGNYYFYVSDLRDNDGYVEITEEQIRTVASGSTATTYLFVVKYDIHSVVSVNVDGTIFSSSKYTFANDQLGGSYITINDLSTTGGEDIVVKYFTNDVDAKAFTFGTRVPDSVVAPYSMSEGKNNIASGYAAKAAGYSAIASGDYAIAQGYNVRATGKNAYAEGGYDSGILQVETSPVIASGQSSHAQNIGTIASGMAQTAIGRYNIANDSFALIIGNGTSETNRSNALVMDWSGNLQLAGNATIAGDILGVGDFAINGSASIAGNLGVTGNVTANGQVLTRTRVKGNAESNYRTGDVNITAANIGALALSGGTLNGDLILKTTTDASPDIVFKYGDGTEKCRIWVEDTYTSGLGPKYRVYKSDGTQLFSGRLVTTNGDTFTGQPQFNAGAVIYRNGGVWQVKNPGIDAAASDNGVDSGTFYPGISFVDASNRILSRMEGVFTTNGAKATQWYVRQYNTSGETTAQKGIKMTIPWGSTAVTYTVDDSANFRSAIGAQAALSTATATTGFTINTTNVSSVSSQTYKKYGNVVSVDITIAMKVSVGTSTIEVGTLPNGYRPSINMTVGGYMTSSGWVTFASGGKVYLRNTSGSVAAGSWYLRGTFVV